MCDAKAAHPALLQNPNTDESNSDSERNFDESNDEDLCQSDETDDDDED